MILKRATALIPLLFLVSFAHAQQGPPITVGATPVFVYSPARATQITIVQTAGTSIAYTIFSVNGAVIANRAAGQSYVFIPTPPATNFTQGQPIGMISIPSQGTATFRATAVNTSAGVTSLNTLTGAVTLAPGTNITLVPVGNTITINAAGGSFPRLDQVLDPTADKTFAMGNHLLKFNNGAVLAGVYDAAMPGITGFSLGTQSGFAGGGASLTPFISLAELNGSAPALTASSGFTGANLAAFDTRTSGVKIGGLAALQLDTTVTTNIGADSMYGVSSFVWDQGTGADIQLLGFDSGVEKDGGTVSQNMVAYHAQGASNAAAVTGFVAGMWIENQGGGSGTSAATYGLKIDNQTTSSSPFAIKTGLGKVELGDAIQADNLTASQCVGTDASKILVSNTNCVSSLASPGAIGGTTPAAGTFTTLTATKINGSPGSVSSVTGVTSSNPTINTDQNLIQLSLAAGFFNTSLQPFDIDASGIYSSTTASSPAITIKAKLCTVSGCGSGTVITLFNIATTALNTTALTNATWNLTGKCVTNATGAGGNLFCHGKPGLTLDTGAALTAPDSVFADTNTATSSNIDLTAALFLQFTVAQSATGASNSYTQQIASIR